jgi:Tetratricopeptide repeat
MRACAGILLFSFQGTLLAHPCAPCHAREVAGYQRNAMSRSLRTAAGEPDGEYDHAKSNTRFLLRSSRTAVYQRMEHDGQNSDYRIDYVIGSGIHASCYLARVGDHLFESPICRYPDRYGMAPGYEENPAPGFTRPVTVECLLCHSGRPLPIRGTLNGYRTPAFSEEAISCDRCHGDSTAHLKRPIPGSIVNPAKLRPAERDSICERCHLAGAIRVLNPGKNLTDFHPGQLLESAFTTYVAAAPQGTTTPFRVISQSEQLAQSRCLIASQGRLWCGTCHDPHDAPKDAVAYYRGRCLTCHQQALPAAHPAGATDCMPCHMPRREAADGGHIAFTDHRIQRRPEKENPAAPIQALRAWREPPELWRARNRALAWNYVGVRYSSSAMVSESYQMLLPVERAFPNDSDVLAALGNALLNRNRPSDAARIFERALSARHDDPSLEDDAGEAYLKAGDKQSAARHFEKALALDPLLLPDVEALLQIYRDAGDRDRQSALMRRVQDSMRTGPLPAKH